MPSELMSENDFRWQEQSLVLLGGRCQECGAVAFPRATSCVRCTSEQIDEHVLPTVGDLWSWTVQRFQPKDPYIGPTDFQPYGVGYVDLGELIVEARLTTTTGLEIGQRMILVAEDFGGPATTFAFAPEGALP